jgi:5'-3' exoribonuclease 2
MGVPAFFRWLSRKYPSIIVNCVEEKPRVIDGVTVPIDCTQPNPNGVEFDNLYLDMNGIIHPCCHPEDKAAPSNEDEMMVDIFEYIDRLMAIVRPRRLLYMAIDGVAPRAKMNQQRSRRFRASKETKEKRDEVSRIKDEMRSRGLEVPPDKADREHFDSNCITPGTEFMFRLADCLRYYIYHRLNTNPAWAGLKVILSDANVPGEGEHKIMDYIRRQRSQPDHDPNTHHCLCGADADLIMLGLATHEPNFTIIREEFKPNKPRPCEICGQLGHEMKECTGSAREKQGEFDQFDVPLSSEQSFIFLRINVLREYLYRELTMTGLPFPQDLERAIDDWVLMCFFVGNDFLPHLPSLEIREGAIDRLIGLYKRAVYKTGGYLTDSGSVNLARVQLILTELGEVEDEIFKKRRSTELDMKRRDEERKKRQRRSAGNVVPRYLMGGQYEPSVPGGVISPISKPHQTVLEMRQKAMQFSSPQQVRSNYDAAAALKSMITSDDNHGVKRKSDVIEQEEEEEVQDEVKLWEDGWKDRYYQSKFGVGSNDHAFRNRVANAYVLGMCWVLKYYYQGCASWDWYFPYHYAPFASDFVNIGDLDTEFDTGTKPFRPLEQLMSVFPAASMQFLPPSWQTLMTDPESPIIDFYPEDFKVDLNGKKFAWQGVALLPFVDERRLLETLEEVYPNLTTYEVQRNTLGSDRLFIGRKNEAYDFLLALYEGQPTKDPVELDPTKTVGVRGTVWCDPVVVRPCEMYESPLPQCEDIRNEGALSVLFHDPTYKVGFVFPARMLKDAKLPEPTLKPEDFNRKNPGQQYWPQTGFARGTGHRPTNPSTAIRTMRAGIGAYSHAAPPARPSRPAYGGSQGYGPPASWQRSLQGQATAYQQNQQRGYQQGYSAPQGYGTPQGYGHSNHGYSNSNQSGGYNSQPRGYGYQGGNHGRQEPLESYSTSRRDGGGYSSYPDASRNGLTGRPPYPPSRRY